MPPKKPKDHHKVDVTLSLKPSNVKALESYDEYGYRSRSHMADDAIAVLVEVKKRLKAAKSEMAEGPLHTESAGRGRQ